MKKIIYLCLILLCQFIYSSEQKNNNDYILKIEFWPSFSKPCILELKKDSKSLVLSYKEIRYDGNNSNLPNQEEIKLFIAKHKNELQIKESLKKYILTDSVFIRTLENVSISKNYDYFKNIDLQIDKDLVKESKTVTLDGTIVNFIFTKNKKNRYFSFEDLKESDKNEILENLYELCLKEFKNKKVLKSIIRISTNLNSGLTFLKKNNTYKFYGSLYHDEYKSVYKFLKNLPKKEKPFFDFKDYCFTRIFAETFKEFSEKYENRLPSTIWLIEANVIQEIKKYDIELKNVELITDELNYIKEKTNPRTGYN